MSRPLYGLGLFVVLYGLFALAGALTDPESYMSASRFHDVTFLYALVPAYFLSASGLFEGRQARAQESLIALLGGVTKASERLALGETLLSPRPQLWPIAFALLGAIYGIADYPWWQGVTAGQGVVVALGLGNGFVWLSVGWFLGLAITNAGYLRRLGERIDTSLFDLRAVKPVAAVASFNVFVTMGALALMPLQSLSSSFQIDFYVQGFVVGIPAAIALFILPQWGVRKALKRIKAVHLDEVDASISAASQGDTVVLETLLAHRDRIVGAREWPVDHGVFSRAVLYLVVPPLAWVGAAIVERGVDQLF